MKKNLLILASALFGVACSSTPKGYEIKGNIQNLNGKVYLGVYEGKQLVRIDSTDAANGVFTFKGNLELPMLASIESAGEDGVLNTFFLENSPIVVEGDAFDKKGIVVKGSVTDEGYQKLLPNMNSVDSMKAFVTNNPNSVAAAYVLFRNLSYQLPADELDAMIANFPQDIQTKSVYIEKLRERIAAMKNSEVGQPYMEIALPDTAGNVVALSSVVGDGKYVLLDFWASWCGPCRRENPHVVAAYHQFKDKGFTVFGVSLDKPTGKEDWKKAIVNDGLEWNNVSDLQFWECAPAKQYGVGSIPSNFLIGPDGTIVAKNLRGDALTAKLTELLGQPKK